MSHPKVFIIILNWNRPNDTLDCLESLKKLNVDGFTLKVVLVDNGSSDDSVKQFKKYNSGNLELKLIENKDNHGFAAGNNVGIAYALDKGADYLFILNNDTIVDKNIIIEFLAAAKKYSDSGMFTPKIYFAKGFEFHKKYKKSDLGKVLWSAGGSIDWNNVYATNKSVDEVDRGQYSRDLQTDFATGAAMFVRADVIQKYGAFDERYFMYLEDVDLCERYKKDGGKIMYVYKAVLWHKVAQSSAIGSDLNDYYITRNRLLFGMGYASWKTRFALYRESVRFIMYGRPAQKKGVFDFYTARFGKGTIK